jgi:transposase
MNRLLKLSQNETTSKLPVFVDISKDHLDYTIGLDAQPSRNEAGRISYRLQDVSQWIETLVSAHNLDGPDQLEFVCEPTGGLQHKLILLCKKHGSSLRFVDSERMYNARMITYGNAEKTDSKDPEAMRNLYLLGKSRSAESVEVLRETVRALSREYEDVSQQAIGCRNRIHQLIGYVFPDYCKSTDFTFSPSGQALAKEFGFCPQRIVGVEYAEFRRRLQTHVKGIRHHTTEQLWLQARRSVEVTDAEFADPRSEYLDHLYKQWIGLEERKEHLKTQLKAYGELFAQQGWLPRHLPPSVSHWMVVRVVAECGPFTNFDHIRQLWAFLGLKLACRQSGTFKGKIKITKKGSPLARKLLYQICLPLVKSNGCMYEIYRKQNPNPKQKNSGQGIRAINVVMRKLVKVLFAMHRSGQEFDAQRLGCCQSQYRFKQTG